MTVDRRLMEQALESLQTILGYRQTFLDIHQVMEDLNTRLEQPQCEWQGLTDEEIDAAVKSCSTTDTYKYFRAIEAKLREKNGL